MLIDKATGEFYLYCNAFAVDPFKPGLTKDQFETSELGENVVKLSMSQLPWESYKLPPVLVEERTALSMVLFYSGLIKRVEFGLYETRLIGHQTWEDYSEDEEATRKLLHDEILARELGEPHDHKRFPLNTSETNSSVIALETSIMYRYRWGTVWSGHDSRGGSTYIRIEYRTPRIKRPSIPERMAQRRRAALLAKKWAQRNKETG